MDCHKYPYANSIIMQQLIYKCAVILTGEVTHNPKFVQGFTGRLLKSNGHVPWIRSAFPGKGVFVLVCVSVCMYKLDSIIS